MTILSILISVAVGAAVGWVTWRDLRTIAMLRQSVSELESDRSELVKAVEQLEADIAAMRKRRRKVTA